MAVTKQSKFGGLSALAIAIAALTLPAGAIARPDDSGRDGRGRSGESSQESDRGGNRGGGGWAQRSQPAQQQQAAPAQHQQRQVAAPRQPNNGNGWQQRNGAGNNANADAPRWGPQRPAEGERRGRDWANGGAVNRPAPAYRGATPNVPDRVVEARRSGGQAANHSWRGGNQGEARRDGQRRNGDNRNGWNGNRDQRSGGQYQANRDGNRSENWRNDHNRNDSYRNDGHRDVRDSRLWHGDNNRRWDRHDWRRDNRYNWSSYRNHNRHIFQLGNYYSPYRNYSYRRLSIGFSLGSLFYGNRYWINDPWQYRLPDVYGPYRWVRYYDDVLLVDVYSGEVVDVIYDFFD